MAKRKNLVLIEDGQIPDSVASLLKDTSLYSRYQNLKAYLDEEYTYEPADYRRLVAFIERQVYDQVLAIAHLQYYLMNLTGDWGDTGEQQVKISFCRSLLGLGPEIPLTEAHAAEFYSQVDTAVYTYGFEGLTPDTGKSLFESKVIQLLGVQFKADPGPKVTQILRFLGSKTCLVSRPFWKGFAYIYGDAIHRTKAEYSIWYMVKERVRCGSYVMSNVATVTEHNICMREEALATVFYQKWIQAFEPRRIFHFVPNADEFSRMSMAIKYHTLGLFGVKTPEELEKVKSKISSLEAEVSKKQNKIASLEKLVEQVTAFNNDLKDRMAQAQKLKEEMEVKINELEKLGGATQPVPAAQSPEIQPSEPIPSAAQ